MKSAFICLLVVGACVYGSAGERRNPERPTSGPPEDSRRIFDQPLIIQRLLRYPIGVLKIVRNSNEHDTSEESSQETTEERSEDSSSETSEEPTEEDSSEEEPIGKAPPRKKTVGPTPSEKKTVESEEEWQPLPFDDDTTIFKSVIKLPGRCKDQEKMIGGKCRKVVEFAEDSEKSDLP